MAYLTDLAVVTSNGNIVGHLYIAYNQNIAGNYTDLTADLYIGRSDGYSTFGNGTWEIWMNGSHADIAKTSYTINTANQYIGSFSTTVAHNADGTGGFSVAVGGAISGTSYSWTALSGGNNAWITLPTIARATQPSLGNITAGTAATIDLSSRASSSFKHTLYYYLGSRQKITIATMTTSTSIVLDANFTKELANAVTNTASSWFTLYCDTNTDSGWVGTKSIAVSFTIPNAAPFLPTVSFSLTPVNQLSGNYVKTKSSITYNVTAAGAYGSTYTITSKFNSVVVNTGSSSFTHLLSIAGTNIPAVVSVTDSRGRTATATTQNVTVQDYSIPYITSFVSYRSDGTGVQTDSGTTITAKAIGGVSAINNVNTAIYKLERRPAGGSWTTIYTVNNTTKGYDITEAESKSTTTLPFDEDTSYEFRFSIEDEYNVVTKVVTVNAVFSILDFYNDGKGLAIGKMASSSLLLEVDLATKFNKVVEFDTTTKNSVLSNVMVYDNVVARSGASSETGLVKITFPSSWISSQFLIEIDMINYQTMGGGKLILGGNMYPSTWSRCYGQLIGNLDINFVKFGHDGTNCCILINKLTAWEYSRIIVSKVTVDYATDYSTGWAMSLVANETGITSTQTVTNFGSVPTGTIMITGCSAGGNPPPGFLFCNGASLSRTAYANLYGIIGTFYGYADANTFYLPDFRDRMPIGANTGGIAPDRGSTGGEQNHTLSVAEMPQHRHNIAGAFVSALNSGYAETTGFGGSGTELNHNMLTYYAGSSSAHNNMPPYLGINFMIKY